MGKPETFDFLGFRHLRERTWLFTSGGRQLAKRMRVKPRKSKFPACPSLADSIPGGESPELDQPGLVRMQRQLEALQPCS